MLMPEKGRNILIKITDDRKLGDINKKDVHSNTEDKMNALEDWDNKKGRKCMTKTGVCFLINIRIRSSTNAGKGK